jgi:[methyl-Co(III) methanol-specific corrinoid protein]:coenzyme M methyltransferase
MSRKLFMDAVDRRNNSGKVVFGTGTSIACQDLMEKLDVWFPDAHVDAEKMARLAIAGHTELGFDVVMPLFSVCHEGAAMGCNVNWGGPDQMPEAGEPIFGGVDDIVIPDDLEMRPGCTVPLEAIRLLKKQLGEDAAVCGKVFGPWTLSYHLFGIETFLMGTIDDPDNTRRILDKLMPVAIRFAKAQVDAGADCLLLGDHATRDLCSPQAYETFLKPVHQQLSEAIDVPLILHICGHTADRVGFIAQTGIECFHWDTQTGSPSDMRALAGDKMALMGGISNYKLLRGTPEEIAADAVIAKRSDMDIVGPECAIPLLTPLANLKAIAAVGRERLN